MSTRSALLDPSSTAVRLPAPAPAALTSGAPADHTRPDVSGDGDDDDRRRAILADPRVHARMRKIIRKRGASADVADDVLQESLAAALENLSALPLDPDEAALYLCGVGRFKAIDHANERAGELDRRAVVDATTVDPRAGGLDDKVRAHSLLAKVQRRYPQAFSWWFRNKIGRETHAEIAKSAGKAAITVRTAVKGVAVALASAEGKRGLVTLAVLLAVVFGVNQWRVDRGRPFDDPGQLSSAGPKSRTPVAKVRGWGVEPDGAWNDAVALRERARGEASTGDWDLVTRDLTRANALDLAGETPELAALLDQASDRLGSAMAKPGAMPPRHHHAPARPLPQNY